MYTWLFLSHPRHMSDVRDDNVYALAVTSGSLLRWKPPYQRLDIRSVGLLLLYIIAKLRYSIVA